MAKKVYKKPPLVFYEADKDLYDALMEEVDRTRSSMRSVILNLLERELLSVKSTKTVKDNDIFCDIDD